MSSLYARKLLKISVAQILQTIGYQSSQTIALDVLTEILERYMLLICTKTREYSEIACRTESTLDDLALTFEKFKIVPQELEDFITNVELVNCLHEVAKFPKEKENRLGFVNDRLNKELIDRVEDEDKEHIDYYFPLMEKNDQEVPPLSLQLPQASTEKTSPKQPPSENKYVLKNGSQLDNDKWMSSYELKVSQSHEKNAKIAQAKFPPAYYRQRLKPQKSSAENTSSEMVTSEKVTSEKLVEVTEVKINVSIEQEPPAPVINRAPVKSHIDDLMDKVITKYAPDKTKQQLSTSESSKPSFLQQINTESVTFPKTFCQPKPPAETQTASIVKNTQVDDFAIVDEDTNESKSSIQLKIKMPTPSPMKISNVEAKKCVKPKEMIVSKGLKLKINLGANPNQTIKAPTNPSTKTLSTDTFSEIIDQVAKSAAVKPPSNALDLTKKVSNNLNKKQLETSDDDNKSVITLTDDDNKQSDPIIWKPHLPATQTPATKAAISTPPHTLPPSKQQTTPITVNKPNKPKTKPKQTPLQQQQHTPTVPTAQQLSTFSTPYQAFTPEALLSFNPFNFNPALMNYCEEFLRLQAQNAASVSTQDPFNFMNMFSNPLFAAQLNEMNQNFNAAEIASLVPPLPTPLQPSSSKQSKPKNQIKHSPSVLKTNETDANPKIDQGISRPVKKLEPQSQIKATEASARQVEDEIQKNKKKKKDKDKERERDKKRKYEKSDESSDSKKYKAKRHETDFCIQETKRESQINKISTEVEKLVPKLKFKFGPNPSETSIQHSHESNEHLKPSPIPKLLIKPVKPQAEQEIKQEPLKLNPLKIKFKLDSKPDDSNEVLSDAPVDVVSVDETCYPIKPYQYEFESSSQEHSEMDTSKVEFKHPMIKDETKKKQKSKKLHSTTDLISDQHKHTLNTNLFEPNQEESKSSKHKHKKKHKSKDKRDKKEIPELKKVACASQLVETPLAVPQITEPTDVPPSVPSLDTKKPSPSITPKVKKKGINEAIMNIINKKGGMTTNQSTLPQESTNTVGLLEQKQLVSQAPSITPLISPLNVSTPQKPNDDNPMCQLTNDSASKQMTIMVQTEIYDNAQQVWICPCCKNPDDGTPMIGCDSCDDWYHWSCLGINQEPAVNKWYCSKCSGFSESSKSKKKKKKKSTTQ